MFPWGWGELEGVANRGDYDLKQHSDHSGEKLTYFDPNLGEHYVPHVIEPAAGATRSMMAFLLAATMKKPLTMTYALFYDSMSESLLTK